ncbi:MAG: hypothetical protein KQH59_01915 [Desulfobulbaceae bacterium]|nr:hypothetical protein [Desulfobulbaceae bacterium]
METINLTPENEHLLKLVQDITGMSQEDIINKCIFDAVRLYYPYVWCNEDDVFDLYYDKKQQVIKTNKKQSRTRTTKIDKPQTK